MLDSDQSAFFERELEFVKSQTYDIKYPMLKARDLIPVDGSADEGATAITYQQYDRIGQAKIISHNAKDIPRVDLSGKEFTRPTKMVGGSYGMSMKEIRSAMMAGKNLDQRKASNLRFAVEEELDEIAAVGAPEHGIPDGFVNNGSVNVETLGGGSDWATLIAGGNNRDVVTQMEAAVTRILDATKGIHRPNTIVIPEKQFSLISMTPFGDNSDKTILEFVLSRFADIQAVIPWYRLKNAAVGGATDRMIVYERRADILGQDINQEFMVHPAQEQGLEMVVIGTAETAGTVFYYPLSADYTDGI